MIRTLKAIAVLGTAYIALLACPSGTVTSSGSPSANASVAIATSSASPSDSATPLPSATESASESPSESATTAPTEAPSTAPTTAPTSAPTQATTAAPTTAPTTAPTVAPTAAPTVPANPWAGYIFAPNASGPVPSGFTRYGATVVDASTGAPVVGACVYTGPPSGCPLKGVNRTDANGVFAVDLPSGSSFAFNIQSDPQNAIYSALIQISVSGPSGTLKMTHK